MIAKHVPMRSLKKSDMAGLVAYITSEQGKQERLGQVNVTNCEADTLKAVVSEILATQYQNTRAVGDKTYHLLLSFPAGENPSADVLNDIEKRMCASIGFEEHQRVSAVHYDTDHLHLHIAINKVHPVRLTLHEPYRAYKTLGDLATRLEIEHGLQQVSHEPRRRLAEGRAADMEQHSGVESLVSWIRRECLDEIREAQNWTELHQVLAENGLELRKRGNGLVIESSDGIMVKASTVDRNISKTKLENKFGPFEASPEKPGTPKRKYQKNPVKIRINTDELYARYKVEAQNLTANRPIEWERVRSRKDHLIESAKKSNRLRRAVIKLMGGRGVEKKLLYAQAHKFFKKKLQTINKQYKEERQALFGRYQRLTWADWLKQQALSGDAEALIALRARESAQGLKGNTIEAEGQPRFGQVGAIDNITKKGTIIYRSGTSAVRDDGNKLQVSREATIEGIQAALYLAIDRYGEKITVNGTAEFKEKSVLSAVASQIPVVFTDPILERQRQHLLAKENKNGRPKQQADRGRSYRGGVRRARPGATAGNDATRIFNETGRGGGQPGSGADVERAAALKPNVGGVGRIPPPQSQHRLRTLSELGVVRLAGRGEMLLPGNVPGHLEQQGTKPDNGLRRGVFGAGVTAEHWAAAENYIAEREQKRLICSDIPKHFPFNDSTGVFTYAGSRNVKGHALALLKTADEIMVVPIGQATAQRLKRVKLGDPVTVNPKGSIKTSKGKIR